MRLGRSFPIKAHYGVPPAQGVYSAFNQDRANIIAGLDAATSPTNGWNNEVRDSALLPQHVVRTSSTVVTITLPAVPAYDISSQEIITATVPASALVTSAGEVIATPTFTIDAVGGVAKPTHAIGRGIRQGISLGIAN